MSLKCSSALSLSVCVCVCVCEYGDEFAWSEIENVCDICALSLCVCVQYGDEFAWSEIENVWTTLADSWPKNLKIILHFLISMSGVNSEPSLLPYVSDRTHIQSAGSTPVANLSVTLKAV